METPAKFCSTGKVVYTKGEAKTLLRNLKRKDRQRGKRPKRLHAAETQSGKAYRCQHCGGYHVGRIGRKINTRKST